MGPELATSNGRMSDCGKGGMSVAVDGDGEMAKGICETWREESAEGFGCFAGWGNGFRFFQDLNLKCLFDHRSIRKNGGRGILCGNEARRCLRSLPKLPCEKIYRERRIRAVNGQSCG